LRLVQFHSTAARGLLEGHMGTTGTVRQAKLRPECAERYPTLPACRWTSATGLADLVASCREAGPERPRTLDKERTLSEVDFEFRGGLPQLVGWVVRAHPH
jgi:hypothetical protein